MGWDNNNLAWVIGTRVDAHGGEAEERGQQLEHEMIERITKAIQEIIDDPKYKEIGPFAI